MDAIILLINNGYNPFTGQGGLGYKPPIEGRIHGGQFELVKYNPESKRNDLTISYGGKPAETYELMSTQPTGFLWDAYLSPETSIDDKTIIINTIEKRKQEFPEEYNKQLINYNKRLDETKRELVKNSSERLNELKYKNSELYKKYFPKKKEEIKTQTMTTKVKAPAPVVLNTKRKKEKPDDLLNNLIMVTKTRTHGLENRIANYEKTENPTNKAILIKTYKDTINYGLDLISKNPHINTVAISDKIDKYIEEMNKLILKGNKYELTTEGLVEIINETDKDIWKQDKGLSKKSATKFINEYYEDNEAIELKPLKTYEKEINDIINEINASKIIDELLTDSDLIETSKLSESCVNKKIGTDYLETVEIDGETLTKKEMDELDTAGKRLEYGVCGSKNKNAITLFNVRKPQMQVTDFLISDIYHSKVKPELQLIRDEQEASGVKKSKLIEVPENDLGAQFCQDNIDMKNEIINEMKDYNNVNYKNMYNINIELKKIYMNELKDEIKNLFEDYKTETSSKKLKKLMKQIEEKKELLTNKDEFDKSFYKNKKYMGIPITINKWNKVVVPDDYDYDDSPSTEEQINYIIKSQGQKFIPYTDNRYIIGYEQVGGSSKEYNEKMTDYINEDLIQDKRFQFMITVRFKNGIGVYNYTMDDLVDNDFILGTYKTSYAHDTRALKYNSVLIPIEKYILKK